MRNVCKLTKYNLRQKRHYVIATIFQLLELEPNLNFFPDSGQKNSQANFFSLQAFR